MSAEGKNSSFLKNRVCANLRIQALACEWSKTPYLDPFVQNPPQDLSIPLSKLSHRLFYFVGGFREKK